MSQNNISSGTGWSPSFAAGGEFGLGGGTLDAECRAAGVDPDGVADFSTSVNPLGPPHCFGAVMGLAATLAAAYPDPECMAAREALAAAHKVRPESLLLGNGSAELLHLAMRSLSPSRVLVLGPSSPEYIRAAVMVGAKVELRCAPASRLFRHDLLATRVVQDFHLVIAGNPNDPTGTFISPHEFYAWAAENPGTFFLIDEGYVDFVGRPGASLVGINARNIVVLKSPGRFFGIPGLRLGMLWADPEVVRIVRDHQSPWSVNAISQKLAAGIYSETGYIETTHRIMTRERSFLVRGLTEIGFRVFDSPASFLLLRIEARNVTAPILKGLALRKGVLILDCSRIDGLGEQFVRVAIRRRNENERLLEAMQKALEQASAAGS